MSCADCGIVLFIPLSWQFDSVICCLIDSSAFEKKLLGTAKFNRGPAVDIYTKSPQVVPLCTPKNPMPAELRTYASWAKSLERQ